MAGIRIQNIPNSVTEKQLRIYFSNPKHGGGAVRSLYYPMPNNSAVVIYEDTNDAQQVLLKKHKVGEDKLIIRALPRHVYRGGLVEIEPRISEFIRRYRDIVDELQYLGELTVDFNYDREAYVLKGEWYQLEWALQYIDSMLVVYEFDKQTVGVSQNQAEDSDEEEEVTKPEIKKPNIPLVSAPEPERGFPLEGAHGVSQPKLPSGGNYTEFTSPSYVPLSKSRKNKNSAPLIPGESLLVKMPQDGDSEMGKAMRNNLSMEQPRNKNSLPGPSGKNKMGSMFGGDSDDDTTFGRNQNLFGPARMGRGKAVQFDPTTDFSRRRRPAPPQIPHVTKGISVAHTDFGDAPLSYEFTIGNNLTVCIAKDNITRQTTDCIVNATSRDLGNQYGISKAIVAAAGQKLQVDCMKYIQEHGDLKTTQVMHTFAGGLLDQHIKFILHTAGPGWREKNSVEATHALVCTYINCLQYADIKLRLKSIAIPLISAGTYGFPLDVCVQAFYDAILLLVSSSNQNRHIKDVKLICFDEDTAMAVIVIIQSLLDCQPAQSVCAAVDRYRSNVSQNGFGAENFILASEDVTNEITVEIKPQVAKPSNDIPRGRKNKNSDPYVDFLGKDREGHGMQETDQREPLLSNRGEPKVNEWQVPVKQEQDSDKSDNDDDDDDDNDDDDDDNNDKYEVDDVDEESTDVNTGMARKLGNIPFGTNESYDRKPYNNFESVPNPLEASGPKNVETPLEASGPKTFETPLEAAGPKTVETPLEASGYQVGQQDDSDTDKEEANGETADEGLEDLETEDEEKDKENEKSPHQEVGEGAQADVEDNSTEETVTRLTSLLENIDVKENGTLVDVPEIDLTVDASGYGGSESEEDDFDEDSFGSVGGSMVKVEKSDVELLDE